MKKILPILLLSIMQVFSIQDAYAGVDLAGRVKRMQVAADGTIWFSIDSPMIENYCKPYWYDLNMYINKDNPNYSFYYGMLMLAAAKARPVVVANISFFDGSIPCDIGRTGYGLVVITAD